MVKCFIKVINIIIILIVTNTFSIEGDEYVMRKANQDIIIYNQIDKIYDYDKISAFLEKNKNMQSFFEKFNVEYYKSISEIYYTVLKTNMGLYMIIFNEDKLYSNMQHVFFSDDRCEDNIKRLKVGMTLDDAQTADPNGQYDFIFHSWSGYSQISYHYFNDGKCFAIRYENNKIANIICFTL